jgi:protease I
VEEDMDRELEGRRIAILAEDNYNELELWYPLLRMREAGARADVIGMAGATVYHSEYGYPVGVDLPAGEVSAARFDAVIVPGGFAPDLMRRHQAMLDLVRGIFDRGGVVAFICRGAWVPISAGILRDRRATSLPSIQDDVVNAGGLWEDEEVVQDGGLISSRDPHDLPAFCRAIIAALAGDGTARE